LAARKLRGLARSGRDDPEVMRTALRVMHDAFNDTAGRAVFASHRELFLASHPQFAPEAAAVRSFFDRSNQVFFARAHAGDDGVRGPNGLAELSELARSLARLEHPGG
jgi:mxaA protein